ncbi:MAG TPA: glycosyltransferase [Micromonosporaceae bacterium]|jgi:cellulose synthase (UDP-forming)|nr:glycosyltransferase [Micromonosporaceae bacterium]
MSSLLAILHRPSAARPAPDASLWAHFPGSELPPPETTLRRGWVRLVGLSALAVTAAYLVWRTVATLHGATLWLGVPLLVLEGWALISLFLYTVSLWDLDAGRVPAPVRRTDLRVAALIPTYNEPREVLLPTIAAAVAMRLPHETWVLDDGRRPWVAELAASLGARYTTREGNEHAKAGNINALLPRLTADLIAVFDADHVAEADFLVRTLGYFDDPRIALVQTPQDFYNLDSFEHIERPGSPRYGEQELFYRGLAAGRNRWDSAFWCGTNAVVRLSALREVGGVATQSVTEDIHTTIRLHRRGWKTAYHNEVLARGLAAGDAEQYLTQRLRWGTGAMQVLRTENPAVVSGLRPMQRVSYLSTLLGWFDSWRTLGYVLLPVATVLTGAIPIAAPAMTFLAWFSAAFVLQRLALRALARGRAPQIHSTLFEFVRLPANLQATTALFARRPLPFVVTPKGRQGGDERRRTALPRLIPALLVLSGLAAAWYAATSFGLTPVTYRVPWVAHGAAVWLLVNAVMLVLAAKRIRHLRFAAERRASVRFERAATVSVDGVPCQPRDVSLTGASVAAPGALLRTGQQVRVRLDVGGTTLVLRAVTRSVVAHDDDRQVAGLEFHDIGHGDQARLALALFGTGIVPQLVPAPDGESAAKSRGLRTADKAA